ncbi:MAG: hypothetical protein EOO04_38220, partial [Chitinophagaceae bacterium]
MKKLTYLVALLVLSTIGYAQTGVKKPVATAKPAAPVKVTSIEGITEYALANGMRVLLFPDQTKPTTT